MSITSISVRTRLVDGSTQVNLRISHPMETGTRKDSNGVAIPSWYLTDMDVFHKEVKVASIALGPIVSRNPALSFVLNGGEVDDELKITWVDNRGEVGERTAVITA